MITGRKKQEAFFFAEGDRDRDTGGQVVHAPGARSPAPLHDPKLEGICCLSVDFQCVLRSMRSQGTWTAAKTKRGQMVNAINHKEFDCVLTFRKVASDVDREL
jgi:hypothetical protein